MSAPGTSLWLSVPPDPARVLTSATLDEGPGVARDVVALYIVGELAVEFTVEPGIGAMFLRDCGLTRQP